MDSHDVSPTQGRKPGFGVLYKALLGRIGRRRERSVAMSYLLDATELPGEDWTNSRQASFRSVRTPFRGLPHLRCVSASRNFQQSKPTRYLFIEIAVMDSSDDANRLVETSRTRFYRKPGVTIVGERELTECVVPAVEDSQLYERETVRGSLRGVNRRITGRIGDVFLGIHAGASGDGWEWADVMNVATLQAGKINKLRPSVSENPEERPGRPV